MTEPLPTGLDWQCRTHPALTLEQASARLQAGATSTLYPAAAGLSAATRCDALQVASNSPIEDRMTAEDVSLGDGQSWQFWAVFDGHRGYATAEVLRHALISYVVREMKSLPMSSLNDAGTVVQALKKACLQLDHDIISNSLQALKEGGDHAAVLSHLAPAVSGSCALLALHNKDTAALHVACVGDSRAVLGCKVAEAWTAKALSTDQTARNAAEAARLQAEHPGEPEMLEANRLLGIGVTRAFGDHRWKWPVTDIEKAYPRYYANPPRPKTLTPPYLTAEPVVVSTTIQPGDFLILAVDGVWDNISSEHAVLCVAEWITQSRRRSDGQPPLGTLLSHVSAPSTVTAGGGKPETPAAESWGWSFSPEDLVVEDDNAATHLAKNALGGQRREQFRSIMSTNPPECRDARDDLTIQIVFFGQL